MSKRNKQKSKQRTKAHKASGHRSGAGNQRHVDFTKIVMQVTALMEADKADEALELLEPLLKKHPQSVELLSLASVAYSLVGNLWLAIASLERVQKFAPDPFLSSTLAGLYLQAGMNGYAMQSARSALKGIDDPDEKNELQTMLTTLEQEFAEVVQSAGIAPNQAEIGLRHHDDAQRAMGQMNMQAAIDANRRAIRILGNWPPPHNNLAQALFYNGQPAEAITTTQTVLARNPDNFHALSNAIKFLAWSGKIHEAQSLWDHLQQIEPRNEIDRYKQAEAAAILAEDESVYQILKPIIRRDVNLANPVVWQTHLFFALAEANTGRTKSAMNHLRELDEADPRVERIYESLKSKHPGIGWSTRYDYFSLAELAPISMMNKAALLMDQRERLDERQFRKRVERLVEQYPQLLLVGKKLIWEEQSPQAGMDLLALLGTPEAYALVQEFGLSQVGEDQDRLDALVLLQEAGKLDRDQPVRMWSEGEWREVKLISYEINDEPEVIYSPSVVKLFERAIDAFRRRDFVQGERLYRQIIALEPGAAEAYFNLGTILAAQDDIEQAKLMYQKAIEIRPFYALPRCQLAHFFLNDEDVESAKEILLPLMNATRLNPQEMTHYLYTQARILVFEDEYEKARAALETLLKMSPDFTPAQELLDRVGLLAVMSSSMEGFFGNMRHRQGQRRARMQTKIMTADVTVEMALSVFTREVQGSMARVIIPGGGWSALKKKELHARLVQELSSSYTLEYILADLSNEEIAALRAVLAQGGTMAWDDFDEQYDNDMEENPDWQYHNPVTIMGRLRQRALLAIAFVEDDFLVVIPLEIRKLLSEIL